MNTRRPILAWDNLDTFTVEREQHSQRRAANTADDYAHLQKYRYTALRDPSWSIRLLKVTKRHGESSFEAELTETCLVADTLNNLKIDIPQYTALSYTWGQPDDGKALIIDGKRLHIRSNVHNFLTHVSAETTNESFWIDAVCIDQSNIEERGQQVKLMRHVYSQASKVRVWLGCGNETLCWLLRDIRTAKNDSGSLYVTQMRELRDAGYRSSAQKGYTILSQLDYWTRLWIVQEIFFARDIVVHYDREHVSWNTLRDAWTVRQKVPAYGISTLNTVSRSDLLDSSTIMNNLINVREKTVDSTWRPLSLLFLQLDNSECTQEHDRIYAILSLVGNGDQFPVDYDCSLIELLIETLAFVVRTEEPNHDNIQVFQKLADKLLVDLDLDNDEQIYIAPRSALSQTRVPRGRKSSSYQPWPSRPRHHILSSEFGEGHGTFIWSTSRSTTLFTQSQGDTDTDEEVVNPFGDNTEYIRHFLRSKTSDKDLVAWNDPLGILLILSPCSPASPAVRDYQPRETSQKANSTWIIRGRVSYDRSLRRNSFFGAASRDRGFYELYIGAHGLPGAQVKIPESDRNQNHGIWKTTPTLTITDARTEIILFGLPEHQGIRLAAMDLMMACGGHPDFLKVEFWADATTNGSTFELRDRDIEVSIPSSNGCEAATLSCIQYRPYAALVSQKCGRTQAKRVKKNSSDDAGECYHYIDFLSEDDRKAACNALVEKK